MNQSTTTKANLDIMDQTLDAMTVMDRTITETHRAHDRDTTTRQMEEVKKVAIPKSSWHEW